MHSLNAESERDATSIDGVAKAAAGGAGGVDTTEATTGAGTRGTLKPDISGAFLVLNF